MSQKSDLEQRICTNCYVAIMFPHEDWKLYKLGWYKCTFCSFCKVIEKEIYTNRIKNQK